MLVHDVIEAYSGCAVNADAWMCPVCTLHGASNLQELQNISSFLEACSLPFSIEMAAALAARKLLSLETWLLDFLHAHQDAAVQVSLSSWKSLRLAAAALAAAPILVHRACRTGAT